MTDQQTFTPGPWEVGYGALNVYATDHKGKFPVCDIRGWGHFTGKGHGALGLSTKQGAEIQTANARLIAAAPELLAALKAAHPYIEHAVSDDLCSGPTPAHETLRKLIAAIAKADGVTEGASMDRTP